MNVTAGIRSMAEIGQLKAENERYRKALAEIASDPTGNSQYQADLAKDALAKGQGK